MVFHEPGAAAGEGPDAVGARSGPAAGDAGLVRPLNVPLLCWHESARSARTDPLVALAEDAAFIATDRPVPVGTPVFLELSLGHASNAARAQIDAVVVSGDAPVEMAGFVVRFVDVDEAVLTWIQHHLASATQKRGAAAKVPETLDAVPRSPLPPPSSAPLADEPWALPPPTTPNPFAPAAQQVMRDDASDEDARDDDDDDVDDLPEMADFEELGAEVDDFGSAPASAPDSVPPAVAFFDAVGEDEPEDEHEAEAAADDAADAAADDEAAAALEPPPAPDAAARSSLDVQVEEALGNLSADAAMDDAFSASFSPWVELPEGDAEESGSLDLAREPPDPFGLELPDAGGPLEASDGDDPPAPPALTAGGPAADDDDAPFGALALPSAIAAVSAPAAAKEPETFDPFADADETSAPLPAAAAPLASDEFAQRAGADDVDVDVVDDGFGDDGGSAGAPSDGFPGLAEAGVGFSNPFARKASDRVGSDDDIGELDATREEIPHALPSSAPPAPPVVGETMPWGIDRQSVLDAAERRAAGGFGEAPPAALAAPPPPPAAAPSPAPLPPSSRTTPEGLTPIFGTRPPSGLFRPPPESAPATASPLPPAGPPPSPPVPAAPGPAAPPPRPASAAWPGPPQAPEPSSATTAPYSIAPGPGPGDAAAPGEPPRAPGSFADEIPRFPETQRFGIAPGGPPLGAGFPGGPAPSAAPSAPLPARPSSPPSPVPAVDETERYRIAAPAPGTPAVTTVPGGAPGFRTPTLEFAQPGPADAPGAPAAPRPHTPTLREFAAVSSPVVPPAPRGPAAVAASPDVSAVSGGVPPAPRPRSLGIPGLGPEDDVVEVSTTSQLVRASEGGLASLVAKDKAARGDLPMQSVTGGKSAVTVEGEAFREPSRELDPFAAFASPAPSAPPRATQPDVWFPGEPVRAPGDDPPTGVLGTPPERPVEAWQVRGPARTTPAEPEELPVVAGVLEDDELPLVHASPLEPDPAPPASEPWVIGGPGRDPKR